MKWKFWQRAPKPQPVPGELYRLWNDVGNPFDRVQAQILDVKDGWVKYCFTTSPSMHHTREIKDFMRIYKKDTS